MELFSAERPNIANTNTKALLIDGSAVPRFVVSSIPNERVTISAMLQKYDVMGGYAWHETELSISQLSVFFLRFENDPEATLSLYFGWEPKPPTSVRAIPISRAPPVASPLEDLL